MASEAILGAALPYWPALLVSSVLVYVAARLSWRYFEKPLIERGRRPYGRTTRISTDGVQQ